MMTSNTGKTTLGRLGLGLPLVLATVAGCAPESATDEATYELGEVVLHIMTVPADTRCLLVDARGAGRNETRRFDITPGQTGLALSMSRLPVGPVVLTGQAFAEACSAVTESSVAEFVSDPVNAQLQARQVANIVLAMKRNGRAALAVDWEDDAGIQADAGACANPVNVALNASTAGSDPGWGGGANLAEVVDGITCYGDWAHGLAFSGGTGNWNGQTCGWRQATVDFGATRQLTGLVEVYHHGAEHIPNTVRIEVFENGAWREVLSTTNNLSYAQPDTCPVGSTPTRYQIGATQASRLRYSLNNCDITHGWLYEIVVQGC